MSIFDFFLKQVKQVKARIAPATSGMRFEVGEGLTEKEEEKAREVIKKKPVETERKSVFDYFVEAGRALPQVKTPVEAMQRMTVEPAREFFKPTEDVRFRDVARQLPETGEKMLKLGTDIVQDIARVSGGGIGMSLYNLFADIKDPSGKSRITEYQPNKDDPKIEQAFKQFIFGKEAVKPSEQLTIDLGDWIKEARERGVWEAGKERKDAPEFENIFRKHLMGTLEKHPMGSAMIAIPAMTILDFTGFGGGKKQVFKYLAKVDDVTDTAKTMRQVGIAEDIIEASAPKIAKMKNADEIARAFEKIDLLQKSTKISPKAVKPRSKLSAIDDYQAKVTAGQDLGIKIGKKVNPDGTLTLYHGTSKQNAESILKGGKFNEGVYFSVKKTGTEFGDSPLDVAKRKFGKDATIMEIKVDARDLESAAAGSEVFSPKALFKEDGIWKTTKGIKPISKEIYHGTSIDTEKIIKEGFVFGKKDIFGEAAYFTDSKKMRDSFGKNYLKLVTDDFNLKTFKTKKEEFDLIKEMETKNLSDAIRKQGKYDGFIIINKHKTVGNTYAITNKKLLDKTLKKPISPAKYLDEVQDVPDDIALHPDQPKFLDKKLPLKKEKLASSLDQPSRKEVSVPTRHVVDISSDLVKKIKRSGNIKDIISFKKYSKMPKLSSIKNAKSFQKFKDSISKNWINIRELVEDDWVRVKKLVQRDDIKISEMSDPYSAEILMHGRMGTRVEEAKNIIKNIDKDILKLSKQVKKESDIISRDVDRYLVARHAPERNASLGDMAAGISTKKAKIVIKEIESLPEGKEIIKIADKMQELNNRTLDVLLEGEVIDKKLYDILRKKYKNHIPLNRVMEDTEDIGSTIAGRPYDVRSTGILKAKGSEKEIADVMTNITNNYEQAIIRAEKNRVDLATLQFARDNKHLELFKEVKPPQIPVAKITHKEAIDKVYFEKVIDFAESLGGKVITKGQPSKRLGYFAKPSKIVRKTATPREVLSHELGHFLDNKFQLKHHFYKRGETKDIAEEMIGWMEEIGESSSRIKNTNERFADSFEWWLANRRLAEERLPLFSQKIESIIKDIPELKPLIKIEPSGKFIVQGTPEIIFRPSVDKLLKDPTILTLRKKGEPIYLKIEDPNLAVALRGVNRWKVDGVMKVTQAVTRFYSQLATRFNPEFFFPNKVRDLQEAVVYMASKNEFGFKGASKASMRDPKSIKSVMDYVRGTDSEGAKLYNQMRMDGGTTGGLGLSTRKKIELDIRDIRKINRNEPRKAAEKIVESIDNLNQVFEDSTRLSIYKEALESGVTRKRAAVLAKEGTINFNKFGKGGPVINAMYMFSNASIQGSAKMLRAMRNPKVAGVVISAVGIAVVATNEWNDKVDPDWRDKVSKWDKMNSLPVIIPTKDGGITYISIPVSWGLKPIKVSMDHASDIMAGKGNIKNAMSGVLASVMEGYNPVGGTDILSGAMPTIFDMPVELARNQGWHGGKIRPDWDKNAPASIKYFDSLKDSVTGRTMIGFSKGLSGIGIEMSPSDMKYAYETLVGGAGRFTSKTINTISAVGKQEIPEIRDIPFVSRFLRERKAEQVGAGSKKYESVKKILEDQSRERFILEQQAEDSYNQMKNIPKEDAKKMFNDLVKEDPNIAKKVNEIIKEEKLGLNYVDRLVKQLGVSNGERAKFIVGELNKLKTKKEKKSYYQEMIDKKIISEEVGKQIIHLLNK